MTTPDPARVPVVPVVVGALVAQFADDAVHLVLPLPFLGPLGLLTAVLLTAGAARVITRRRTGAVVARTGLAVGLTSAAIAVVVGGVGLLALLLGGLTVAAGVAGAVERRAALPPGPSVGFSSPAPATGSRSAGRDSRGRRKRRRPSW